MDAKPARAKAAVLVGVVFILGILLGGAGIHYWGEPHWPGANRHNHFVRRLTRELSLTSDQQKQLNVIINDTVARWRALDLQYKPEYEQVRMEARDRIRAILTPEQKPQFEDFVRRLDEERRKREAEESGK